MKVIDKVQTECPEFSGVVLTVGSFDGVHLGHRRILDDVFKIAGETEGTPAVLTMYPHPREILAPDHAPNLLTSQEKKLQLFDELGVEIVYVLNFDAAIAALEPEQFVEEIVVGRCKATALVVGHDCAFGKGARGNFELLKALAPKYGYTVEQVPPLIIDAERVSSTLIRERVLLGDLDRVESLLGRKYSIVGEVVKGRGKGAQLGFPTANIEPSHSAVPAHGVYIAQAELNGNTYAAAVNIGIAPTIRHDDVTIEAHLLDFSGDIVGDGIEIVFHERVRPEKKFPSLDALCAQIDSDVERVRKYFSTGTLR